MAETVSVAYIQQRLVNKQAELKWVGEKWEKERHTHKDMMSDYRRVRSFRMREVALLHGEIDALERLIEEAEHNVAEYDVAH